MEVRDDGADEGDVVALVGEIAAFFADWREKNKDEWDALLTLCGVVGYVQSLCISIITSAVLLLLGEELCGQG